MDPSTEKRGKRKRKKGFLQKAKGYAKRGNFGRGTHITEDVYQYFFRVLEMSRQNFESEEDKEVFVTNAFDETVGQEMYLSCNELVSRAIETLLPMAPKEVIQRFTKAFSKDLRPLFGDPFASHVLQKLLLVVAEQTKDTMKKKGASSGVFDDWVIRVGRFAFNNLEEFAWDTYAVHVVRTVLLCISGGKESTHTANKAGLLNPRSIEYMEKCDCELPKQYNELLQDYHHKLISWPQIGDMAFEGLTSGLLQSLLFALKRAGETTLCDECVDVLTKKCFKLHSTGKEELFQCDFSLHLLDAALAVASPDFYRKVYEDCFKGKVVRLALHKRANFSVQRLFGFCPDKLLLEEILAEFTEADDDGLKAVFSSGHHFVLSYIAQACQRLGHKQGVFMQELMKVFDCYQPESRQLQFVPQVLQMAVYKEGESAGGSDEKFKIELPGSLIVQAMLHFNKPIKIINSLLEMHPSVLQAVCCDHRGSYIMDHVMDSEFVGAKSREKIFRKLMGAYVALATSKCGSRSLESMWKQMGVSFRRQVLDELSPRENQIMACPIGRIIASKTLLPLYKRNFEDWKQAQLGDEKKRTLFADIIGTGEKS
ncbi:nucleolar protein 9 [Ischnura elegans]|uniref:nucleolar protein 9 n=1 Tax=Ischnura elegans TaxID=197161 RepID=UPI001ED86975|nr:nucleolar protein 9 [Ischnura elegans]